MALQVVCRKLESQSVVELHGWLTGPEIEEFEKACAATPQPLLIHLENLAGASPDGVLALKGQRARGARLVGASPYIELLLRGQ